MSELIINDSSRRQLNSFKKRIPHAMLFAGPIGIGLATIARNFADELDLETTLVLPERKEAVDVEKGTITVKSIRRLYDIAKTKGKPRVIIIDYAERMGTAAQNAFLKLLEEPNNTTHFILLSHSPETLLPTIISRVQMLTLQKVTKQQSEAQIKALNVTDPEKRAQILFIAEGLPAEVIRLQNNDYFTTRSQIVRDARTFITGATYQRSLIAHLYKDDRQQALTLLSDVLKLLSLTIKTKRDTALITKLDMAIAAYARIQANGNIRLQLATALS